MPISTLSARRLAHQDVTDSIEYSQRKVGSLRNSRWKPLANIMLTPAERPNNQRLGPKVEMSETQKELDRELWQAVSSGNIEVAKRVIAHGGNLTARDAAELEGLFDRPVDPSEIGKPASPPQPGQPQELPPSEAGHWPKLQWLGQVGNTCLHVAARHGDSSMAVCLLKAGAEPNAVNDAGCSPLHDAASRAHAWVAQCLLRGGAEPNLQDLGGCTALHLAAAEGHLETVKALMAKDASPHTVNERGEIALHCAVINGSVDMVKELLDVKSNIEATTLGGETPLHIASRLGHIEVVSLLLERGANVAAQEEFGSTALHLAARAARGVQPVEENQPDQGAGVIDAPAAEDKSDEEGDEEDAAAENDDDDDDDDDDEDDEEGGAKRDPLEPAQAEVVLMLIAAGASVHASNKKLESVLHYAAVGGHGPTITNLLVAGADPVRITGAGESVLHWAARSGIAPVVAKLVEFGAPPAPKNDGGLTPLHEALRLGHVETTRVLLAKMDEAGPESWEGIACLNLLHLASQAGDTELARCLLLRDEFMQYGGPVLRNAVCSGCEAMVLALLEAGVPIECSSEEGAQGGLCETFLHDAANNGHTAVVDLLLDAGDEVEATTKHGLTALHFAARGGFVGVSMLLLDAGADVNAAEEENNHTPLHYACRSGCLSLVKVLLNEGADMNAKDCDGRVPEDMWGGSRQQWNEMVMDVCLSLHGS